MNMLPVSAIAGAPPKATAARHVTARPPTQVRMQKGGTNHASATEDAAELPAKTRELLSTMFARRSRRFAAGGEMPGGKANPLAFKSVRAPAPLTLQEEAAIAMSAVAITGYANAELPLHSGPDGNGAVLTTLVGRAVASPDAAHTVSLFVINDEGVWFVRRPQNLSEAEVREQLGLIKEGKIVEAYQSLRVKIADGRRGVPRNIQHTPSFNIWDHNRPGTTVFLPVMDLSTIYLAAMMSLFNADSAFNVIDEHANYALAGTAAFGKSRGGQLNDKVASGRLYPLDLVELFVDRMATIELGEMVAHMALVGQSLGDERGIGGFPHYMGSPAWFDVLGFRHAAMPAHKLPGLRGVKKVLARVGGQPLAVPIRLEHQGEALLKPYTPENYPSAPGRPSMEGAVRAYLADRFGPNGTLRTGTGPFQDNQAMQKAMQPPTEATVNAVIAFASYVYDRYGRFPSETGPLSVVTGYQAHRIDDAYYRRFYV